MDKSKFVNHFDIDAQAQQTLMEGWGELPRRRFVDITHTDYSVEVVEGLITPMISQLLREQLDKNKWLEVGLDGKSDHTYDEIGNYRLSNWNPGLADRLWQRLQGFYADRYLCNEFSPTCWDDHPVWRPVAISPLFRYIRYAEGGKLVAHYDDTFVQDENTRTLESLVIYLTTNVNGATRFINDDQVGMRMDKFNFADWDRAGKATEVAVRIPPKEGNALVFPHRILHDSEPLLTGDAEKIIIRTDIMFEKVF